MCKNRLPEEVVSSLREDICEQKLKGRVSVREATDVFQIWKEGSWDLMGMAV